MTSFLLLLPGFPASRRGTTAVEYALMASAIGTVVFLGATQLSGGITNMFNAVTSYFVLHTDSP